MMHKIYWILCGWLLCVALGACGAEETPPAVLTPLPPPTAKPGATLQPQATSAPIATAGSRTPWPPNLKNFVAANDRIVDLAEVDTDGDGVSEMLVIYQDNNVGRGLVIRREGDNGRAYPLGGDKPAELFQANWTANTVRDVNGDGKIEIMVEGVIQGTASSLNIFQWNGKAYVSLLSLSGSEGVAIDDAHNSGVFDFTALQTLFQRSAIIRATHAEWKQTAYAVKSDVLFLLGAPSVFNNPEEAALAYYIFLDKDEPAMSFSLLTEPQKSKTSLKALDDLSRAIDSVRIEALRLEEEKPDGAVAALSITYTDHATQKEQTAQHRWRLQKENNQWKLAERLDQSPW